MTSGSVTISPQRRDEALAALRRGTVPAASLDQLATGLGRFEAALGDELDSAARGAGVFKAVRGEYGSGKTFFSRWLQERARRLGFVSSEVQVSETQTPLHRLETVYRRLCEHLATSDCRSGALRTVVDSWFYTLEQDVLQAAGPDSDAALLAATERLLEQRLATVSERAPAFAACLRAYRRALAAGEPDLADGLLAWLSGQPNVGARIRRAAGIKGDIDHYGALGCLQGLLTILRDAGFRGLVLVLDEVETLQRVRGDVRDRGLNALRQLMDEIDAGRYPGLYLLLTGTPAFFDGPQGIGRLPPLQQRLAVDFATDARFDNPRAVQLRLPGFDLERLVEVGLRTQALYASHSPAADRILQLADADCIRTLAGAVTGRLGGKVGVAPRLFLKKLVADVLDRIEQFPDFDPRRHYAPTVAAAEMNDTERRAAGDVDDVPLDL